MTEAPTDIADQLYTAPPADFIARRDAEAASAKQAGDAASAAAIRALRKPTIGAWIVNRLARERPDLIDQLTELSASLHDAQQRLRGSDLRELTTSRRAMVASLVSEARNVAVEADPSLDPAKLPIEEVTATLEAAFADGEIAATVRAGRLTKTLSYTGFGDVSDDGDMATWAPAAAGSGAGSAPSRVPVRKGTASKSAGSNKAVATKRAPVGARAPTPKGPAPTGDTAGKRRTSTAADVETKKQEAVAAAREAQAEAQRQFDAAAEAERAAATDLRDVEKEITALQRRLAELQRQHATARRALGRHRTEHDRARRELAAAKKRTAKAEG